MILSQGRDLRKEGVTPTVSRASVKSGSAHLEVEGKNVSIRVRRAALSTHPEALALNAVFQADVPRLKLELEIDWRPATPEQAIQDLEGQLMKLSPSLEKHQCHGQEQYRAFRQNEKPSAAPEGGPEPALALAHISEHVMIDMVSFITGARRVSGATGARPDPRQPFDLFVECPDRLVASVISTLPIRWVVALLDGAGLDGGGRDAMELARHLYMNRPREIGVQSAARQIRRDPDRAEDALECLEKTGFARRVPYTMNFSDVSYFRVCTGSEESD